MKANEAASVVAVLVAYYPACKVQPLTVQLYERAIADLGYDVAQQAIAMLVSSHRYMPTVADIRQAAATVMHGPEPIAMEAWGKVCGEIRRVGYYGSPRFEDETTARCVRAMGWRELCKSGNDAADRSRFCDLYRQLAKRQRDKQRLIGNGVGAVRLMGAG